MKNTPSVGCLTVLMISLLGLNNASAQISPEDQAAVPEQGIWAGGEEPVPEVTIRDKGGKKVEEYRINGRLYMIRVTPQVGPPYYLIDEEGHGRFVRRNGFDKGLVIPTWVIKAW